MILTPGFHDIFTVFMMYRGSVLNHRHGTPWLHAWSIKGTLDQGTPPSSTSISMFNIKLPTVPALILAAISMIGPVLAQPISGLVARDVYTPRLGESSQRWLF